MGRPRVERDSLQIRLLTPEDIAAAGSFRCAEQDDDLDEFLRDDALRLQSRNVVQTYVGLHDGALVAYISLLTDAVVLESDERRKLKMSGNDHPVFPAIKVAKLAVHKPFREERSGTGEALMAFAFVTALGVSDAVGCRLLTLDARPESIRFYEKLGFVRNKAARYKDAENPSMRLNLFAPVVPSWVGLAGEDVPTVTPPAAEAESK